MKYTVNTQFLLQIIKRYSILFCVMLITQTAVAGSKNNITSLTISDAWVRKSIPPNNNSAAYMKIHNSTDAQITILDVAAPVVANNVELHKSFVDESGIGRMTSIDKIVVPANTTIELKPGSIHIMLFDLKKTLLENNVIELTLKLDGNMKPIKVKATVQ